MTGLEVWQAVRQVWAVRPCFICRQTGDCAHREINADMAMITATYTIERKPPTSEFEAANSRQQTKRLETFPFRKALTCSSLT